MARTVAFSRARSVLECASPLALAPARHAMEPANIFKPAKAVLKPPHSKRWRDCQAASKPAKRLERGAFTAAFVRAGYQRSDDNLRLLESTRSENGNGF